jgi:hypothetical protein
MVSALLLTKECMQTSVVSLGNTKQPLPGFQSHGSLLSTRHGELLDNVDLAGGMPEVGYSTVQGLGTRSPTSAFASESKGS